MAKVIIVEDDVLLAKMYIQLLTFAGYEVVVADNGESAVELITKEQPNLVLMDIMMPKMNGLQALEELKKSSVTAQIPVVVMSNMVNVNSVDEVLAKGAYQYIDKTQYDARQIVELVNQILSPTTVAV